MDISIKPLTDGLNGTISAPPSKSYSHRAFIAASLAKESSIIKNPLYSGDVNVTIEILKKLGVSISKQGKAEYCIRKKSKKFNPTYKILDVKNSGTSIRIFTALSLLIDKGLSLKGEFFRRRRPIKPLLNALERLGGKYELMGDQLHIERSKNTCADISIRGDISSQFLTALFFLCPIINCDKKKFIKLDLKTPLRSYPYIKITLDVLESFGIIIQEHLTRKRKGSFKIPLNQEYVPTTFKVPGDFSSASFIIAATVLSPHSSNVVIKNLDLKNPQGDKRIIEILKKMGANLKYNLKSNTLQITNNSSHSRLKGCSIDCGDIPDLFPILSVLGAFSENKMELYNARHLRMKESDRITVMRRELNKMGIKAEEKEDGLIIIPSEQVKGAIFNHENDHRIAMALTIASLYADTPSIIKNIEVIKDSYPNFLKDLKRLGAIITNKGNK